MRSNLSKQQSYFHPPTSNSAGDEAETICKCNIRRVGLPSDCKRHEKHGILTLTSTSVDEVNDHI